MKRYIHIHHKTYMLLTIIVLFIGSCILLTNIHADVIVRSAGKPVVGTIIREYTDHIVVKNIYGREITIFKRHIVRIIVNPDIIKLENDQKIEGIILKEDNNYVTIDTGEKILRIDTDDIDKVKKANRTDNNEDDNNHTASNNTDSDKTTKLNTYTMLESSSPVELIKFNYTVKRLFHGWSIDWKAKLENHNNIHAREVLLIINFWDDNNMLLDCSIRQGLLIESRSQRTYRQEVPVDRRIAKYINSATIHIIPMYR